MVKRETESTIFPFSVDCIVFCLFDMHSKCCCRGVSLTFGFNYFSDKEIHTKAQKIDIFATCSHQSLRHFLHWLSSTFSFFYVNILRSIKLSHHTTDIDENSNQNICLYCKEWDTSSNRARKRQKKKRYIQACYGVNIWKVRCLYLPPNLEIWIGISFQK